MTVEALPGYLREHWLAIREQLLQGTYHPKPEKRVEIPKRAGGGARKLGIPCALDRFVQQAVQQSLQHVWAPTFSEHSYGFGPGRSAHQAITQAQQYIADGYGDVVDLALEKFFDRVSHDRLMGQVAQRVTDTRLLRRLRAFLNAGESLSSPSAGTDTPGARPGAGVNYGRSLPWSLAPQSVQGDARRLSQCLFQLARTSETGHSVNAHPAEPPWYGPVCPVVWERRHREVTPYPDS